MSAAWINGVSEMLNWYNRMKAAGDSGGSGGRLADSSGIVQVKNSTGGDLVRGRVVQLTDYLLTDVTAKRHWYDSQTYSSGSTNQIAIYTTAAPSGIIKPARILGKCTAIVNVTDTGHRFAEPSNGSTALVSVASGSIPILSGNKISGTGNQELTVLLGSTGGGGGAAVDMKFVLIDEDIPSIQEADPSKRLADADITLTPAEVSDGYTVVFQDPPDADYDVNHVAGLDVWAYRRQQVTLKYFADDGTPHAGTARTGSTSTTIKLASTASVVANYYRGDTIATTAGTGSGQTRTISSYNGTTQVATVSAAWSVTPDNTTQYEITSSLDKQLATSIIDDAGHEPPRKVVRYATMSVYYDDGKPFTVGQYSRADFPSYPEDEVFPPDGTGTYETVPAAYLNKRYRGIAIDGVLVTALCKQLPPPALTEIVV